MRMQFVQHCALRQPLRDKVLYSSVVWMGKINFSGIDFVSGYSMSVTKVPVDTFF
jgi:hypothetical protein